MMHINKEFTLPVEQLAFDAATWENHMPMPVMLIKNHILSKPVKFVLGETGATGFLFRLVWSVVDPELGGDDFVRIAQQNRRYGQALAAFAVGNKNHKGILE